MSAADDSLQKLRREHPEWISWLDLIQRVLQEAENSKWEAAAPARSGAVRPDFPLLDGTALAFEEDLLDYFFHQLIAVACHSQSPKLITLRAALRNRPDLGRLFRASINHDAQQLEAMARTCGVDAEAFQSVATLFCVPFLHACRRQWAALMPPGWIRGYCPACGAWPALAEVRGIERSRYFRCGRCGAGWQVHCLSCPYCGITDHEQLVCLLPDKNISNGAVETCRRCLGYVKTFTVLQPSPPAQVMLDDLGSVSLDITALQQGYRRPERLAHELDVTVTFEPTPRAPA